MKYIEKYNRYATEDGRIFRKNKSGELLECKQCISKTGYKVVQVKINGCRKLVKSHRIIFEAFNYDIPDNMVIDHIDTNKINNNIENLRCVTQKENMNNPLTIKLSVETHNGLPAWNKGKTISDFAKKFKKYCEQNNIELNYQTERSWYLRHNRKCRWEV
jgi:hypothetical protein